MKIVLDFSALQLDDETICLNLEIAPLNMCMSVCECERVFFLFLSLLLLLLILLWLWLRVE